MLRQTNAIANGLLIFILIGGYFTLLEALGLTDNIYLRFINFLFVLIGVNNTLKATARKTESYVQRLVAGVTTAFTGILLSALGLFIYLSVFEPELSAYGMTLIPAESNLTFAAVIFVEGFTSSLMVVFIMLQYWKNVKVPSLSSQ